MTCTSGPTRACLRSTWNPQKNRDDFENDRYARECKPAPWVGFGLKSCSNQLALREHREDAKGRKAHFDKISLWNCDLLS